MFESLYKPIISLLTCLYILSSLPNSVLGQDKNKNLLDFEEVPKRLRSQLAPNLTRYIELQRSRDWDKAEAYLSSFYFVSPGRKKLLHKEEERQRIVQQMRERPVVGFTPQSVIVSTENASVPLSRKEWVIWGCAEYEEDGQVLKSKARIYVYCQQEKWLFSQVQLIRFQGGSQIPCDHPLGRTN